jgi:integrase
MAKGRRGHGEGSIYQRKSDGRWIGAIDLGRAGGKRSHRFVTGKSAREVSERLKVLLRDQQLGRVSAGGRVKVGRYLSDWLSDTGPSLAPKTLTRYRSLANHWSELFEMPLETVTRSHVQRILNAKEATAKPQTIHHMRAMLRTALNAAIKDGILPPGHNVAAAARSPKLPSPGEGIEPLTPQQASTLLTAVKGDPLETLITVAVSVGVRRGEALGLRWSDVDLETGSMAVDHSLQRLEGKWKICPTKSRKARRTINLPTRSLEALRAHRKAQLQERIRKGQLWMGDKLGECSDLVFTNEYGLPLDETYVTKHFQRLVKATGLPHMRFHDLRHSCATLLLVQQVPMKFVQELLGHSTMKMTSDLYSHIVPEIRRETASAMDRALGG